MKLFRPTELRINESADFEKRKDLPWDETVVVVEIDQDVVVAVVEDVVDEVVGWEKP